MSDGSKAVAEAMDAFHSGDAVRLRDVLSRHPDVKAQLNEPIGPFDAPPIVHVKSRQMLDVLLEAGANIDARSRWWAGGFGVLDYAPLDVAAYAIDRGATVTIHAAARLGLIDTVRAFITGDSSLVHARGGDGQTPLHMAATVDIADALIDAGADPDARDVDHESTPAQYMVSERQDVARHLVARGCRTDLLMVVALGDDERARRRLDADAACIGMRVDEEWFPKINRRAGGTIYNWTLGFHASAHEVAKRFGHDAVLDLLFERTPPALKVLEACWLADEQLTRTFRAAAPSFPAGLSDRDRQMTATAARNNRTGSVRLMLDAGLPVDARGQHHATPLHWAAFHGNVDMVREILRFEPPLEATDRDFNGTPLGWAIHGSQHGWYRETGDYAQTVELLLRAGASRPPAAAGSAAVRDVLNRAGEQDR
jgi:ankyrin repeat protein